MCMSMLKIHYQYPSSKVSVDNIASYVSKFMSKIHPVRQVAKATCR